MLNNTTWLGFIKKVGYCSKSCVNVWTFICLLGFLKFGDAQNHPSHGFTMLAWKQPCCLGKSSMSSEESKFLQNNYPSYPWGFLKWTTGFQPSEWPTRGYPRVILRAYDMPSQVVFMYAAVWIYNNLYISWTYHIGIFYILDLYIIIYISWIWASLNPTLTTYFDSAHPLLQSWQRNRLGRDKSQTDQINKNLCKHGISMFNTFCSQTHVFSFANIVVG